MAYTPRPVVSVRSPIGSEEFEVCRNCKETGENLPKIVVAGGMVTYIFCPLCALEVAHDIIKEVRALR